MKDRGATSGSPLASLSAMAVPREANSFGRRPRRARVPDLAGRGIPGHTISGRGFNPFKPLRRHLRADRLFPPRLRYARRAQGYARRAARLWAKRLCWKRATRRSPGLRRAIWRRRRISGQGGGVTAALAPALHVVPPPGDGSGPRAGKDALKTRRAGGGRERWAGGTEWSGVEWSGVEWSGVEWSGVEWSGVEWESSHERISYAEQM